MDKKILLVEDNREYIDMLNDSEYGNFRIECESIHKEKDWSTKELFHYFDIDPFSDTGLNTQFQVQFFFFILNDNSCIQSNPLIFSTLLFSVLNLST